MRALQVLLGVIVASIGATYADGTFCWDESPGPTAYRLYATAVGTIAEIADPDTGELRIVTAPPVWTLCVYAEFSSDNCVPGTCCAYVVDAPGDRVYYFLTAVNFTSASPPPTPNEPCP